MRARVVTTLVVGFGLILAGAIETGIHQRPQGNRQEPKLYRRNK
jgi:hypothetical protein